MSDYVAIIDPLANGKWEICIWGKNSRGENVDPRSVWTRFESCQTMAEAHTRAGAERKARRMLRKVQRAHRNLYGRERFEIEASDV